MAEEVGTLRQSRRPWVTSLPAEIWPLIAAQIRGPKTLYSLISTCRKLRDLLKASLYHNRVFRLTKVRREEHDIQNFPFGIEHTRHFEVFLPKFSEDGMEYHTYLNFAYGAYITRIVKAMPNLTSFRWNDVAFERYEPVLILHNPQLICALKIANLKELSISFSHEYLGDHTEALSCSIYLGGFRGLTCLELYQFYGLEDVLINGFVEVLADCPQLKTLGFGLACELDCRILPEALVLQSKNTLLMDLCLAYKNKGKNPALSLEVLRLGHGLWLTKANDSNVDKYLKLLCDISKLQVVHVFNGVVTSNDPDDRGREILPLDWSQIGNCTSLRQLSVSRLEDDVLNFLLNEGKHLEELIVMNQYGLHDRNLHRFESMRLSHLKAIVTKEKILPGASSSLPPDQGRISPNPAAPGSQEAPELNMASITILDRLYDGGMNLEKLSLSLDFQDQWTRLAHHLPRLSRLTQLRISPSSFVAPTYPHPESSLWPGITDPKGISYCFAELAKTLCPSLQFVRIKDFAWQMMPLMPIFLDDASSTQCNFRLRELEWEEMMGIELFAMAMFDDECGLPRREDPVRQ